jgi:hypothetical protein
VHPDTKADMFAAFRASRQLHEMLWHLAEARTRTFDPDLAERAGLLQTTIERAVGGELQGLLGLNIENLHAQVRFVLMDVSEEVRASYCAAGDDHLDPMLAPGADLMGRNLRSRKFCGANLRGGYLIAADLRNTDFSGADLLGADLRDAQLGGADLSRALYLTQPQLNAARGSSETLLPPDITRPSHWETVDA